jgi:excisionase family DNA binding protein
VDTQTNATRQHNDAELPVAYSVPEAARLLRIGKTLAYEAAARGEIPSVKIGSRLLVPRAALERMLAAASQPLS